MSELVKSVIFCAVGIVSVALAIAFQGGAGEFAAPQEVGNPMFDKFTDPLAAKSLTITRFDETLAELREITIKEVDGVWTLPSHQGYPADAENKIRDATTPFVDLKIIRVASNAEADPAVDISDDADGAVAEKKTDANRAAASDADHATFGVLEPSKDKTSVGDEGVGTRVVIADSGGQTLVDIIIGREVKGQEGQRFVRRTGKSPVYVVKIDPDKLPVKFDDWIEKDLLKTSSWDVDELVLKDYSFGIRPTLAGGRTSYERRLQITLAEESNKWKLVNMLENQNGQFVESKLLDNEELNEERIDGLRTALADLKIVDVERKPEGLTADLKAQAGFFNNEAGYRSLEERGFYGVQIDDKTAELLSTDGEVLARTKDGVEYVMRFGGVQSVDTEGGEGKLNRYLLVSAQLNEAKFPPPQLEPLPELPSGPSPPSDASAPEKPAGNPADSSAEDKNAADCGPQDTTEDTEIKEESGDKPPSESTPAENTEQPKDDSAAASTPTENTGTATDTPAETTAPKADTAADKPADGQAEPAKTSTTDTKIDAKAERDRIEKENKRKTDERNDKIKKAKEKVRDLNYRFADWYYVIPEDVYKKIHLGKADIIKETEKAKAEGSGLDAFEKLRQGPQKKNDKDATDTDSTP